ncbi:hypothetical protein ACOME3_006031 [Neoechinorhynchus agilis]
MLGGLRRAFCCCCSRDIDEPNERTRLISVGNIINETGGGGIFGTGGGGGGSRRPLTEAAAASYEDPVIEIMASTTDAILDVGLVDDDKGALSDRAWFYGKEKYHWDEF